LSILYFLTLYLIILKYVMSNRMPGLWGYLKSLNPLTAPSQKGKAVNLSVGGEGEPKKKFPLLLTLIPHVIVEKKL
jgi:hypothetical protein